MHVTILPNDLELQSLNWQQKLRILASLFAAIAAQVPHANRDGQTKQFLNEAIRIIDACTVNIPDSLVLELSAIQREWLAWKNLFPVEAARGFMAFHARNQSIRFLHMTEMLPEFA
ncbi:MAG: hypothetical protein J7647_14120 [Cyanobacteria bacterium SBLK]|nr:hypothetical protein [Cyanobacteria bacterium SBLK]